MYASNSPSKIPSKGSPCTLSPIMMPPPLREPLLDTKTDTKAGSQHRRQLQFAGAAEEEQQEVSGQHQDQHHTGTSTVAESVFNTLNVYVGLGLLSKPYAISRGGCLSLVALAILCAVANVTGKLIVRGFAKLPANDRSYAALGQHAFGPVGHWLVLVVLTLEFLGALMVVLIFVWKNALLLAPWYLPDAIISEGTVALITTLAATPTVWALNFGQMSSIGLLGVVASCLIVGVVVGMACYIFIHEAKPLPPMTLPMVGNGMPMAVGIFVLSLGGHGALPGIYASMAQPHKFEHMMDISLGCMFAIYAAVGLAGYLAYGWLRGEDVDVLITTNMAEDQGIPSTLMTLAVVAKSFCAISPVTGVLADLPELLVLPPPNKGNDEVHRWRQRTLRTALLWFVAILAYPCSIYNGLALVEAVTGAMCSMLASMTLPCATWVALYRHETPASRVLAASALAVAATIGGAFFTAIDIIGALDDDTPR